MQTPQSLCQKPPQQIDGRACGSRAFCSDSRSGPCPLCQGLPSSHLGEGAALPPGAQAASSRAGHDSEGPQEDPESWGAGSQV